MTNEKLTEVIELHAKWLRNEEGGKRANLSRANLRRANLSGADLRYTNLRGANLRDANLRGADLRYTNLSDANLRGANLRDANLRGADLRYTNLSDANLRGADLSGAIKVPIHCKWSHGISAGQIHIGCERMSISEWDQFFASDREFETKRGTPDFKQIQAVYNAYKAYLTTLNEEHNEK